MQHKITENTAAKQQIILTRQSFSIKKKKGGGGEQKVKDNTGQIAHLSLSLVQKIQGMNHAEMEAIITPDLPWVQV